MRRTVGWSWGSRAWADALGALTEHGTLCADRLDERVLPPFVVDTCGRVGARNVFPDELAELLEEVGEGLSLSLARAAEDVARSAAPGGDAGTGGARVRAHLAAVLFLAEAAVAAAALAVPVPGAGGVLADGSRP